MCPTGENAGSTGIEAAVPDDCFAERVRGWVWLFGAIVVVLIVFSTVKLSRRDGVDSLVAGSLPQQHMQQPNVQHVAMSRCPYCPGLLDAQGRCNVAQCPVYSQNWGRAVALGTSSQARVVIKQLAMEVGASPENRGVMVGSVYGGGKAELAGLQVGDVIVRFNNRRVKDVAGFESLVAKAKPESKVKVQVIRNGKRVKMTAQLGEGEMEGVTVPNATPAAWSPAQQNPWCYRR